MLIDTKKSCNLSDNMINYHFLC